jgi:DNA (cytosine-5)-methyltransferase 1
MKVSDSRLVQRNQIRQYLILSLFPGIDLLGFAFELVGFCVVRGPDVIVGQDIRDWHATKKVFDGIIGGAPCQEFSVAKNSFNDSKFGNLLPEFERAIREAQPYWYLAENVPKAPYPNIEGYHVTTYDLDAADFGSWQMRHRRFAFGCRDDKKLDIKPFVARRDDIIHCVTATKYKGTANDSRRASRDFGRRMTLDEIKEAFGLDKSWDATAFTVAEKYRALGNGVPLHLGYAIADAIRRALLL